MFDGTPGGDFLPIFVQVRTVVPHLYSRFHPNPFRFGEVIIEKPFSDSQSECMFLSVCSSVCSCISETRNHMVKLHQNFWCMLLMATAGSSCGGNVTWCTSVLWLMSYMPIIIHNASFPSSLEFSPRLWNQLPASRQSCTNLSPSPMSGTSFIGPSVPLTHHSHHPSPHHFSSRLKTSLFFKSFPV